MPPHNPKKPRKSSKPTQVSVTRRNLTQAERTRFLEAVKKGKLPVPNTGKPTSAQLERTAFIRQIEAIVQRGILERRTRKQFKGRH